MKSHFSSSLTLGILGGGQLGKMLVNETRKWDVRTLILDPSPVAPCSREPGFVKGDFSDYKTVLNFGKKCDILTIEIEHVNIDALEELQALGVKVFPQPSVLEIIQNKARQKQFYTRHDIPTVPYKTYKNIEELKASDNEFPFVWKAAQFGYDGMGVKIIHDSTDIDNLPEQACISEKLIDIDKEYSVIVSRNEKGEIAIYPPVEMLFHSQAHLVEFVLAPASVNQGLYQRLIDIAKKTSEAYAHIGLLAVEMIYSKDGILYVNEVAPRPHNSGHFSIEGSFTNQYEQHLRAILGLPPGNTDTLIPAVMFNLTGEEYYTGNVLYAGVEEILKLPGVNIHIYGKKITRPFRKMGHVTVINQSPEMAHKTAIKVKNTLRVIGDQQISCD